MKVEEYLSAIIKERGIKLSTIAERTEIPYQILYDSLFNKKKSRELRSSELIAVCVCLDVSPMEFADKKEGE